MCQHRKWHLHRPDHLSPLVRAHYFHFEVDEAYTIGMLEHSNDVIAITRNAIAYSDRKRWPATEIRCFII